MALTTYAWRFVIKLLHPLSQAAMSHFPGLTIRSDNVSKHVEILMRLGGPLSRVKNFMTGTFGAVHEGAVGILNERRGSNEVPIGLHTFCLGRGLTSSKSSESQNGAEAWRKLCKRAHTKTMCTRVFL